MCAPGNPRPFSEIRVHLVICITLAPKVDIDASLAHEPLHTYTELSAAAVAYGSALLWF
jgi:hypothetical protein